jgi:hypothetical protein
MNTPLINIICQDQQIQSWRNTLKLETAQNIISISELLLYIKVYLNIH